MPTQCRETRRLPAAIQEEIDILLDDIESAHDAEDAETCLRLCRMAWRRLPAPRSRWDFYPAAIAEHAISVLDGSSSTDEMDRWIERIRMAAEAEGQEDVAARLAIARALRRFDREDEALHFFRAIVDEGGENLLTIDEGNMIA